MSSSDDSLPNTETSSSQTTSSDVQRVLDVIGEYFTVQNTLLFDMMKRVEKITLNEGDSQLRERGLDLKNRLRNSAGITFDNEKETMGNLRHMCAEFVELERAANHVERHFLKLPDAVPEPDVATPSTSGVATPSTPDDMEIRNLRNLAKLSPCDHGPPTAVEYAERLIYVQHLEDEVAAGPVAKRMRTVPPPAHSAWPTEVLKYKKNETPLAPPPRPRRMCDTRAWSQAHERRLQRKNAPRPQQHKSTLPPAPPTIYPYPGTTAVPFKRFKNQ